MDFSQKYCIAFTLAWVLFTGGHFGAGVKRWWAASSDIILPIGVGHIVWLLAPLPLVGRTFGWW